VRIGRLKAINWSYPPISGPLEATAWIAASWRLCMGDDLLNNGNMASSKMRTVVALTSFGVSAMATCGLSATASAADGRFTGDVAQTPYGPMQVEIVISNNRLVSIDSIQYPQSDPRSLSISQQALPILNTETLAAQSTNIQGVGGASYTAQGWVTSLASAIAKANWKSSDGNLFPASSATPATANIPTPWEVINNNDGFSKTYTITRDSDDSDTDEYGNSITHTIEIQCTNKKLALLLYSSSPGIFPKTNLSNIGSGSFKIDSGKVVNFSYVAINDQSGVAALYPKTITTSILKAKKSFSFKILSGVQGPTVANFSLSDMKKYAGKFKSLGCSLN